MREPEYTLAWTQLRAWVAWLANRYRLGLEDRLPSCWPHHPELIEELWALRAWRAEAYGQDGSGQSAVYWHQALVTFLTHTATWWAAGCRAGHQPSNSEIEFGHIQAWATADPLAGVPALLRPTTSIPTDPATEPGVITMPTLDAMTDEQMYALTSAGLAHPQHDTIAAFTYYDGSWWVHADPAVDRGPRKGDRDKHGIWLRTDDDLASDPTFRQHPGAKP